MTDTPPSKRPRTERPASVQSIPQANETLDVVSSCRMYDSPGLSITLPAVTLPRDRLPRRGDHADKPQLPQPQCSQIARHYTSSLWLQKACALKGVKLTLERAVSRSVDCWLETAASLGQLDGQLSRASFCMPDQLDPTAAGDAATTATASLESPPQSGRPASGDLNPASSSQAAAVEHLASPNGSSAGTGQNGSVGRFDHKYEPYFKIGGLTSRPDIVGTQFDSNANERYFHVVLEIKLHIASDSDLEQAISQCIGGMICAYVYNACGKVLLRRVRGIVVDPNTLFILEFVPEKGNPEYVAQFKGPKNVPRTEVKGEVCVLAHEELNGSLSPAQPALETPALLAAIMTALVPQCSKWDEEKWHIAFEHSMREAAKDYIMGYRRMQVQPSELIAAVDKDNLTYGDVLKTIPTLMGNTGQVATLPQAQENQLPDAEVKQLEEKFRPIDKLAEKMFEQLGSEHVKSIKQVLHKLPPNFSALSCVRDQLQGLFVAAGVQLEPFQMTPFLKNVEERAAQEASAP